MKTIIICLVFFVTSIHAITFDDFVIAINKVETGGKSGAISGDGGTALGPLQIHRACWLDSLQFNPSIKGRYENCADFKYSKKVMEAYLKKYVPGFNPLSTLNIKDCERMARVWNRGPVGYGRDTIKYWNKVRTALDNLY